MTVPAYSLDGLQERLAEHKKCFDSLIELIPAKYYFSTPDEAPTNRYAHNKKNKAPKQVIKEATKRAKKAKLDPANAKSVLDIQAESLAKTTTADDSDAEPDAEPESEAEPKPVTLRPLPSGSVVELKEKLKRRMEELRAKRKAPTASEKDEETATPKGRQEILEKREKRKRERKEGIRKQKEKRRKIDDTLGMAVEPKQPHGQAAVKDDVMFSKVDFGIGPSKKRKGPTDIAGQLKQAEAKKAKLAALKQSDTEAAAAIEESSTWSKLNKLASGEKVKDDVKLLKKSLKRKEKVKEKSSAAWQDRQNAVKKEQDAKQKKREENIKAR
ncbi:surfeit locus protein 6-domain-containing protein, partial [Blyttiomyces helicus]